VGLCQGVYYIAMEYIPGKNLYRLVSDEGPLPVPRAARLFAEVAAALDHAHNQGLIHRDLKPSNIIITPHDHAKVLDLGLAIVQGEVPADREVIGGRGYVVGTMDYIAPEQAENAAKVDPRSDIYSLGCTLYFALTGQPPFPGGTAVEKIQRHRGEDPVPVPRLNAAVPPAFIGLLRKMMAKDPEQRFATATEVQEKLLSWTFGDVVLPLDRQGDKEYQHAVAQLESAEVPLELIAETIPVGIPVPAKCCTRRDSPAEVAPLIKSPLEALRPFATRFHLLIGLGILVVISLVLGGLVTFFLTR
jgi:serine/threonine protein kinase